MLHHLDQERPCNGVKSLGDINFQQYSRELPAVQPTARQLHGAEIVMDGLSPIVGRFPCGAGQVILGGELKQRLRHGRFAEKTSQNTVPADLLERKTLFRLKKETEKYGL